MNPTFNIDTDPIGLAITTTAATINTVYDDPMASMILKAHLKQLCDMQRGLLEKYVTSITGEK